MITITIVDNLWAKIPKADMVKVKQAVSFPAEYFRPGPFAKVKQGYEKHLFERDGRFPVGLVKRIVQFCVERDIPIQIEGALPKLPYVTPVIQGMTLREDQQLLVDIALREQRGLLQAPTGSGKTVVGMHIMKAFEGRVILFLVNAKGLLTQTKRELEEKGFENIGIIGDGIKEPDEITVGMAQTLSRMGPTEYLKSVDVIIYDEAHGAGAKSLQDISYWAPAAVKIGLSATPPKEQKTADDKGLMLLIEGAIGPILEVVTINDLREVGILAKPTVKILKPPYSSAVADLKKYSDVYDRGIVFNRQRNKMILDAAYESVINDEIVLCLIVKVEHGNELLRMSSIIYPDMDVLFVQGNTESGLREAIKDAMELRIHKFVIATVVFKTGINIKAIDHMILAGAGKSETSLIQGVGRGMRTTATKKTMTITDFCDTSHKYLQAHTLERIWVYIEQGWLK